MYQHNFKELKVPDVSHEMFGSTVFKLERNLTRMLPSGTAAISLVKTVSHTERSAFVTFNINIIAFLKIEGIDGRTIPMVPRSQSERYNLFRLAFLIR